MSGESEEVTGKGFTVAIEEDQKNTILRSNKVNRGDQTRSKAKSQNKLHKAEMSGTSSPAPTSHTYWSLSDPSPRAWAFNNHTDALTAAMRAVARKLSLACSSSRYSSEWY